MTDMADIRNSIILSFNTHLERMRSLSLPDPNEYVVPSDVVHAADNIIMADIFDPDAGMQGRPISLAAAFLQRVATTVLF